MKDYQCLGFCFSIFRKASLVSFNCTPERFRILQFWTSESFHLYASESLVMEQAQTETENTTICIADLASVNYFQCGKSSIHPTVATEIYCLTQITC
jgi:hypothetical protein